MAMGGIPLNLHFSRHWARTEAHPAQQEASLCCAGALHEGPEAVGSPCWRSSVPPGCKAGRCVLDGPAEAEGDQKGLQLQHCAASGIITSRGCSCAYQEALSCSVPTSELFLNLHAWFYLLNVPLESHQRKRAYGTPNKV